MKFPKAARSTKSKMNGGTPWPTPGILLPQTLNPQIVLGDGACHSGACVRGAKKSTNFTRRVHMYIDR